MSKQVSRKNKDESGLLKVSKPDFLAIAKIHRPHGLNGEVSAEVLTDFPEWLIPGEEVFFGDKRESHHLFSIRKATNRYLLAFSGKNSRDSVEDLRGKVVYIFAENLPELKDNEYYFHDLIGIKVYTADEKYLGILTEVIRTGANDVYVIKPEENEEKDILIPAIGSVIMNVDVDKKEMIVQLQEWR